MSILLSGDFHASSRGEIFVVMKENILEGYGKEMYDKIKYHIILGDAGFMWPDNNYKDKNNYKKLSERPFPVLCVLGNHEPIYGVNNIPQDDIGLGENVYVIKDKPFVAYLKRGKVYTIDGIKFLVLGGALSIDKCNRTSGKTWWENEYWSEQEKKELFELLETDNSFDCVISHTGPYHINEKLFLSDPNSYYDNYYDKSFDKVAKLNDEIYKRIKFKKWFCGHYHSDKYYLNKDINQEYQYLCETTKIIEKIEGKLVTHDELETKERVFLYG